MELEHIITALLALGAGILGFSLARGRLRRGDPTLPMHRPPGAELEPLASVTRVIVEEDAEAEHAEVREASSEPGRLASISDARRRERGRK